MCRCILFNSVLQLTPVKHRRRTHTQRSMWGGGLMLLQLPLGSVGWITNTHLLHHMGILAIPRHPSINSLSLPSVTRGIKHPSLLTTHTVRTKPCADLLKHFRGVFLNDADVKREKERLVCCSDGVLPKKVSRRFTGVSAWSVNVHIVCGCMCNMLMSRVGGKCQAHIRAIDGRNQSPPGP